MRRDRIGLALAMTVLVTAPMGAAGQWRAVDEDWCDRDGRGWGDQDRHCLILEASFDPSEALSVDGGANGGVEIQGWDRSEIEVRAKVWGNARDMERAREIADDVEVRMERGRLSADGPRTGRREGWGVSWEIRVPRSIDLDIETMNGGISVAGVRGSVEFEAVNGGVHLVEMGGDVRGHTTNGGLHVELDGTSWRGEGIDVETTNGGVTLAVPADYSARLETGTVNGGIDIDFPVTVQGRVGRRLTTVLGEGGPTVRAFTTNGGVKITRVGRAIR